MTTLTSAVARRTDPWTSWAAARGIDDLSRDQRRVVALFWKYGPMSDRLLVAAAKQDYVFASDSGIRTRRAELVDMGYVQSTGRTEVTDSGRRAFIWELRK